MRHIIPISGKDSLATALYQLQKEPSLPYEFIFNPTGSELPEVFEWLEKVQEKLSQPIHFIGENLIEIIKNKNYFLPSRWRRYCTKDAKIYPFEQWIGKDDCIVYYGIRADENRMGYDNSRRRNITPAFPLKDAGIGLEDVYKMVTETGLKPPTFFWPKLYDGVCKRLQGEEIIKEFLAEWQYDMLFAWRSRTNCYHCFNMKRYEWVGLLEFHPDLFKVAESMEHSVSEYYWNGKGYPLIKIIDDEQFILESRMNAIANLIKEIQFSHGSFLFDLFLKKDSSTDILSQTSCGLFCGK